MVFTLLPYKAIGAAACERMKRGPLPQLNLAQTALAPRQGYGKMKKLMKPKKLFSTKVPKVKLKAEIIRGEDYTPIIVSSSRVAYEALIEMYDHDTIGIQEEFIIACLNRRNEIVSFYQVSKGGMTGTVVDTRLLFACILLCGASAIILSHNHPSGALMPSPEDLSITRRIQAGAKLLDIHVHDHIIVTTDGYHSFADNGRM
jgi:DNA repair protein RadC